MTLFPRGPETNAILTTCLRPGARPGLLAVFIALLSACSEHGSEQPARIAERSGATTPLMSVLQVPSAVRQRLRTDAVSLRAVPETVTAPGEVSLDLKQVAKLTSKIEGQVERVYAQLGDHVRVGQALVAIGGLHLDQLVEEYLVAKAQADVAEDTFRKSERLRGEHIITERRFVEERGRHLETKARYQHIREKLLGMGLTVEDLQQLEKGRHEEAHRYVIKAPIDGTVVAQNVVLGQGVAPGDELFAVVDISRVWVFANVPIEQARRFQVGDRGTIVPKGGEPLTAPLTYLAPVADERTRTIRIRFEVANPTGLLKPQEYVDVRLALEGRTVLAVPASAITIVESKRGVFVQRDTGYAFVPIAIGREGGGWVEVTQGLAVGEQVVVDGVFDLKNVLLKEHIESGEGR